MGIAEKPSTMTMAYAQLQISMKRLYLLWFKPKVWQADCKA